MINTVKKLHKKGHSRTEAGMTKLEFYVHEKRSTIFIEFRFELHFA
jgi:hypothetical protein